MFLPYMTKIPETPLLALVSTEHRIETSHKRELPLSATPAEWMAFIDQELARGFTVVAGLSPRHHLNNVTGDMLKDLALARVSKQDREMLTEFLGLPYITDMVMSPSWKMDRVQIWPAPASEEDRYYMTRNMSLEFFQTWRGFFERDANRSTTYARNVDTKLKGLGFRGVA